MSSIQEIGSKPKKHPALAFITPILIAYFQSHKQLRKSLRSNVFTAVLKVFLEQIRLLSRINNRLLIPYPFFTEEGLSFFLRDSHPYDQQENNKTELTSSPDQQRDEFLNHQINFSQPATGTGWFAAKHIDAKGVNFSSQSFVELKSNSQLQKQSTGLTAFFPDLQLSTRLLDLTTENFVPLDSIKKSTIYMRSTVAPLLLSTPLSSTFSSVFKSSVQINKPNSHAANYECPELQNVVYWIRQYEFVKQNKIRDDSIPFSKLNSVRRQVKIIDIHPDYATAGKRFSQTHLVNPLLMSSIFSFRESMPAKISNDPTISITDVELSRLQIAVPFLPPNVVDNQKIVYEVRRRKKNKPLPSLQFSRLWSTPSNSSLTSLLDLNNIVQIKNTISHSTKVQWTGLQYANHSIQLYNPCVPHLGLNKQLYRYLPRAGIVQLSREINSTVYFPTHGCEQFSKYSNISGIMREAILRHRKIEFGLLQTSVNSLKSLDQNDCEVLQNHYHQKANYVESKNALSNSNLSVRFEFDPILRKNVIQSDCFSILNSISRKQFKFPSMNPNFAGGSNLYPIAESLHTTRSSKSLQLIPSLLPFTKGAYSPKTFNMVSVNTDAGIMAEHLLLDIKAPHLAKSDIQPANLPDLDENQKNTTHQITWTNINSDFKEYRSQEINDISNVAANPGLTNTQEAARFGLKEELYRILADDARRMGIQI